MRTGTLCDCEECDWDRTRLAAEAFIAAAAPVWRVGDGRGGAAIRALLEVAEAAGLSTNNYDDVRLNSRTHRLIERDGWNCHYCGAPCGIGPGLAAPQADHVIPRSRGGPGDLTNFVLACTECNSSKGARTPLEWLGRHCCDGHEGATL